MSIKSEYKAGLTRLRRIAGGYKGRYGIDFGDLLEPVKKPTRASIRRLEKIENEIRVRGEHAAALYKGARYALPKKGEGGFLVEEWVKKTEARAIQKWLKVTPITEVEKAVDIREVKRRLMEPEKVDIKKVKRKKPKKDVEETPGVSFGGFELPGVTVEQREYPNGEWDEIPDDVAEIIIENFRSSMEDLLYGMTNATRASSEEARDYVSAILTKAENKNGKKYVAYILERAGAALTVITGRLLRALYDEEIRRDAQGKLGFIRLCGELASILGLSMGELPNISF